MSRRPEDLVRLSEAEAQRLIRLYMEAELEILREVDRAMARGNDLRYLRSMLENVQAILEDLLNGNRQWCEQAIPKLYVAGAQYADEITGKAVAGFGAVHQQAVKVLADNTFDRLENVRQVIGRRTEDLYRQYALEVTRQSIIGYKTWKQVSQEYRDRLRAEGITGFRDARDREWNMKTYAEMVARTTTQEAHLTGTANRLLEHGHDLVKITTHYRPCEKCQPWEGKVLSLTGKTPGYPTLEEAKAAGLFHPNCRHGFGLHIDLDAEIEALERDLSEEEPDRPKLQYPGSLGARINPDLIKAKYPAETIIQTILVSDWASRKVLREEHGKHGRDWFHETGFELTLDQYTELQNLVIKSPDSGLFYYVHRTGGGQIALYREQIRYMGKLFKRVGLVYSIDRDERVGFWRIKNGRAYFEAQEDFVEIRSPSR